MTMEPSVGGVVLEEVFERRPLERVLFEHALVIAGMRSAGDANLFGLRRGFDRHHGGDNFLGRFAEELRQALGLLLFGLDTGRLRLGLGCFSWATPDVCRSVTPTATMAMTAPIARIRRAGWEFQVLMFKIFSSIVMNYVL